MSAYPGSEHERRIAERDLHALVEQIFATCEMAPADASVLAASLVAADVRGIHSHGVLRVPEYVDKLRKLGVNPRGRPSIVEDNLAALVVDGGNSMGAIGSHFAMSHALKRARTTNVAIAAVRGSNHCGAMFHYAMMALPENMIGLAMTNALPTMAPWGGKDKIIGINPLAVAIPAKSEAPIVLDAAFSYSSHGKIRIFHQKGYPIPSTWAFDEEGAPTTETEKAIKGLLQPIGEYKGVGLALVFGVLASMLSGAAYGTELGNMIDGPKPGLDGHLFVAIHIAAFENVERFRTRVDGVIRQIRESRPTDPSTKLYAPGGLEAETETAYRRDGIPLNDVTWEGLDRLAAEFKLSYRSL
ncbi:MAG: Ldh family oxidoreductase [Bryobacterales bacterium]|nr:Ldh family oxidoreductase [Bryobacterales bacterium]